MRIALNMYFDESKKKFIKNEILYECFQGERMSEFLDRINTKYYDKLRLHKNSLIRDLVATSTDKEWFPLYLLLINVHKLGRWTQSIISVATSQFLH